MKADAPDREKEAREWAINYFRQNASGLKKGANKQRIIEDSFLGQLADLYNSWQRGERGQNLEAEIFEATMGLAAADMQELCGFISVAVERGDTLPPPLRQFLVIFLRHPDFRTKPGNRGQHPLNLVWRNSVIVSCIHVVAARWDFPATRHPRNKKHASAASIVKDALEIGAKIHLSEKNINNLWSSPAGIGARSLIGVPEITALFVGDH